MPVYVNGGFACCEAVLQSNTGQWILHFALNRAALHLCWVTAHLYEEQISSECSDTLPAVTCVAEQHCNSGDCIFS